MVYRWNSNIDITIIHNLFALTHTHTYARALDIPKWVTVYWECGGVVCILNEIFHLFWTANDIQYRWNIFRIAARRVNKKEFPIQIINLTKIDYKLKFQTKYSRFELIRWEFIRAAIQTSPYATMFGGVCSSYRFSALARRSFLFFFRFSDFLCVCIHSTIHKTNNYLFIRNS